jgi:class 3 adenylate cyclase
MSAAKIAAGDWQHRADIDRADEIGALATAFNEMSSALQATFCRLQKTLKSFERFVPEKFLAVIASNGIENIQVGVASTRTITILFADIRGYTSMSEQMTPLETFAMLNDYLACMGEVINNAGGFIDKYIGDAIMALFDDEASGCALYAALAMHQRLQAFNEERRRKAQPAVSIGIGIHRGEVVMGTIGFTSRIESTVIGDTVNVAARVESLTRKYDLTVLVTESVVTALHHPEAFKLRLVDESVKVKGKTAPVAIYELIVV